MPCRVHLTGPDGKPVQPKGRPFWRDHFVFDGRAELKLPAGNYQYEVERGPEFARLQGTASVQSGKKTTIQATLKRIADLRKSGWFSGDLHVHRDPKDIELLMQAEDLDYAPVITWWNNRNLWESRALPARVQHQFDGNRFYHLMAGEDEREGGALLYFGLTKPIDIKTRSREYPSPLTFAAAARKADPKVWIDIEKPFWWDTPIWLASGVVNSVGLANNHMCRSRMYESEAWGKPRDTKRLPPPRGNGLWTQELYYHILNSGIRIPPSAGSASGVLPNPVGYNRVYVHLNNEFSPDAWWKGLRAGRCFVTNGPPLIVTANGRDPGHVFRSESDEPITINLSVQLTTLDQIQKLEVVHNGRVIKGVDCESQATQSLETAFELSRSGWFLVRTITDRPETFRFASTAPFYVEIGKSRRHISRRSTEFFRDWVDERTERVRRNLKDERQLISVLRFHEEARAWWQQRVSHANAE